MSNNENAPKDLSRNNGPIQVSDEVTRFLNKPTSRREFMRTARNWGIVGTVVLATSGLIESAIACAPKEPLPQTHEQNRIHDTIITFKDAMKHNGINAERAVNITLATKYNEGGLQATLNEFDRANALENVSEDLAAAFVVSTKLSRGMTVERLHQLYTEAQKNEKVKNDITAFQLATAAVIDEERLSSALETYNTLLARGVSEDDAGNLTVTVKMNKDLDGTLQQFNRVKDTSDRRNTLRLIMGANAHETDILKAEELWNEARKQGLNEHNATTITMAGMQESETRASLQTAIDMYNFAKQFNGVDEDKAADLTLITQAAYYPKLASVDMQSGEQVEIQPSQNDSQQETRSSFFPIFYPYYFLFHSPSSAAYWGRNSSSYRNAAAPRYNGSPRITNVGRGGISGGGSGGGG